MDRLDALGIFIRVVEAGSFSAVAKERGISQSTISKAVAALENHLGVPLLTRTTRSLTLTPNGQTYFDTMRRLVSDMADADAQVKAGETQLSGPLKIAASVGFGRIVLTPLIDQFLTDHPGLAIDLNLNDGFINLVEQGIDVAVRVGSLSDSSLIARAIGKTHRALIASRAYRQRHPDLAWPLNHPDELRHHRCLIYTGQNSPSDWEFVSPAGSPITVPVTGALKTNSSEVIRSACLAGMGLCYSPLWLFNDEIKSGEVEVLLEDWPKIEVGIHAVMPHHRRESIKVRRFVDFLASHLRKERS
jgi:DNA-binding transcriptional LysR family regulator